MSLGSKINEIRKRKGLSIDELCELSGIPKGTLSKITAGITTSPTLDTVRAIANALGCKLDDLDDSQDTKKPPAQGGEPPTIKDWETALDGLDQEQLKQIMDLVMKKFMEGGK